MVLVCGVVVLVVVPSAVAVLAEGIGILIICSNIHQTNHYKFP